MPQPPSILPVLPASTTSMIWGVEILAESSPPPPGISHISLDGSMITSPPPTLQEALGETARFDIPDVFHPRWSVSLRSESSIPPPVAEEPRRPSTIPPPGGGREKTMGIMGRAIFKELQGLGYEPNRIVGVAAWFLSLVTDMLQAKREGEIPAPRKATPTARSGLTDELEARFQTLFRDLRADGYAPQDLIWIANELLGQVNHTALRR